MSLNSKSKASCIRKNKTIDIPYKDFELVMEQPVDFEALKVNGFEVEQFFEDQGWSKYFEMLNGPVYPILVKDFWPRCDIIEQVDADREFANKIAENPENNKNKSRKDLGLRDFKETKIRSGVSGSEIILTQSNIAQMLKLPNRGVFKTFTPATGKKSAYVKKNAQECYINEEATPTNKVSDMKETQTICMYCCTILRVLCTPFIAA
ncbi:hypothetical protein A2U01_0033673 [Trifolium medium]|uniref:Cullin-like protein n=1 Tax=Trifolium medium TaxID=97028 RepID=A0A392PKG7_9FABA|nr:hypothetical protein [Trifolium medium]